GSVDAGVAGTKTYSMRIGRSPSSNEGMTALHVAAQSGRVEIVRYLLEHGASTNLVDDSGRTPMDLIAGGASGAEACLLRRRETLLPTRQVPEDPQPELLQAEAARAASAARPLRKTADRAKTRGPGKPQTVPHSGRNHI